MDLFEEKAALKSLLDKVATEYGEPFVGKFIAEAVSEMNWQYNTTNDTLADIAKLSMMKIDPEHPTPEVYQLEGYTQRLMNRIKNSDKK